MMEHQPLVSVIIPTYNRIHTLPNSINSVLNQTYKNLEVIVVDDGSDDGTEEYVKSIEDDRVRYVKNSKNMGHSAARNRGAELAKGEYLAFQDSDDEWMPDKLEKQMNLMLDCREFSMVYCEFGYWQGEKLVAVVPSRNIANEKKQGDLFHYLLQASLISTQTIVVKTEEFMKERGFNEKLKAAVDYEFTLRFAQKHKIGFVQELLVRVNDLPGSVSKQYAERMRTSFYMVQEMLEPLRERNLLDKKLKIFFCEAKSHLCHDIFIEELNRLSKEFLSEDEKKNADILLEEMEKEKELVFLRVEFMEQLSMFKQEILQIYLKLYEHQITWGENLEEILSSIINSIEVYEKIFDVPKKIQECQIRISNNMQKNELTEIEQLHLLTDMVELLSLLKEDMAAVKYDFGDCAVS